MNHLRFALDPQRPERMVKPRRSLYNAVALAAVLALTAGCGGKPTPPPPGAEGDSAAADVELGDESTSPPHGTGETTGGATVDSQGPHGTGETTPSSSPDEKPPADDSGAK